MKLAYILVTFVVANAVALPAQTDSDSAIKSKIVALEQLWNQAYKSGDARALDSILDNSIVLVNDMTARCKPRRNFWRA